MFSFSLLKKHKCEYTVEWLPSNKQTHQGRLWKLKVVKDGKVILSLEDTDLKKLQDAVNRLSNQLK